jgi:hypothetical protein
VKNKIILNKTDEIKGNQTAIYPKTGKDSQIQTTKSKTDMKKSKVSLKNHFKTNDERH